MALNRIPQFTVFRGPGKSTAFTWSPFVIKLEARLRFAGVKYRVAEGSPKTAPRGKIPYVEVEDQTLSDSTFIIKRFINEGLIPDLNASLTPVQKAQDLAFRALMEEKVYFYGTREKWIDNYYTMRAGIFSSMPWLLQVVIGYFAARANARTAYGQGTGRLTDDEVTELREEVWESVDALLTDARMRKKGDGAFWALGGDEPTEVDATIFGFIASSLICEACPTSAAVIRKHSSVMDYAERIHERYFPDYERWE
ncbi:glutathione S-transferase [Fusarium beomiforme]|uniref:Glutathione S-transferase n=1 Tax=Fusarium beomiforme TaxID=44412 RepID=A0A9P5E0V7_9HYPO|nr:glutathione S-transferase [Fusarium beomiforme]